MDTMQAEALRRAQEMHRTQRTPFADIHENNSPQKSNQQHKESSPAEWPEGNRESREVCSKEQTLPALFEDKEKLLILVLILVLLGEDCADTSVILALLYLII